MTSVTISGPDYTHIEVEPDEDVDSEEARKMAQAFMEAVIGDTIVEERKPEWTEKSEIFEPPDWTVAELESEIEQEIDQYLKYDDRSQTNLPMGE